MELKASDPFDDDSIVATGESTVVSEVEAQAQKNLLDNAALLQTIENAKKESSEIQDLIYNLGKDISKRE